MAKLSPTERAARTFQGKPADPESASMKRHLMREGLRGRRRLPIKGSPEVAKKPTVSESVQTFRKGSGRTRIAEGMTQASETPAYSNLLMRIFNPEDPASPLPTPHEVTTVLKSSGTELAAFRDDLEKRLPGAKDPARIKQFLASMGFEVKEGRIRVAPEKAGATNVREERTPPTKPKKAASTSVPMQEGERRTERFQDVHIGLR